MTPDRPIRRATRAEASFIAETLALAFQNDPAFCWIFPDPVERARRLPRLFSLLLAADFDAGMVFHAPDGEAATLWRAPGRSRISLPTIIRQAVPMARALGFSLRRALTVNRAIEAHHPVGYEYWYLHCAAVRPAFQGQGWGGAAIRAGIAPAMAMGMPVYLETATRANVDLYRNHGFRVTDEWDVPGGGPHFWSMLRA